MIRKANFWPRFEKQEGQHGRLFDGHEGVLHILRLYLINRKLNLFMIDIFNRCMCSLSCRRLTLKLVLQGQRLSHKMSH